MSLVVLNFKDFGKEGSHTAKTEGIYNLVKGNLKLGHDKITLSAAGG
jgi:hypothetical protein